MQCTIPAEEEENQGIDGVRVDRYHSQPSSSSRQFGFATFNVGLGRLCNGKNMVTQDGDAIDKDGKDDKFRIGKVLFVVRCLLVATLLRPC